MAQYHIGKEKYVDRNNELFDVFIMADKDGNIINSSSISANINISAGLVDGYSSLHKFGEVSSMSGGEVGSLWGVNDTLYPWATLDAGGTITIECFTNNGQPSTADSGSHVHVYGLDSDFNPIDEVIEIVGGGGAGSLIFHRINDAIFHDGIINANKSKINLNIGLITVGEIEIGYGRSSALIYTVPTGKTAFLSQGTATCSASSDATVNFFTRSYNIEDPEGFILGHTLEVSGVGGQYTYQFAVPIKLTEKTDIDVRVIARQNNTRLTGAYDLILIDNVLIE